MTPPVDIDEDRRKSGRQTCEKLETMEDRLAEGDARMQRIEGAVEALREDSIAHRKQTAAVLDILQMAEGFFKVLGYLGSGIKFLAAVAAAIVALMYFFKGK